MDGVRSSLSRFRVPDAVSPPGDGLAGSGTEYVDRPLPLASAILWTPIVDHPSAEDGHRIFITQAALASVHAHVAAKPRGTASLGFLAGSLCLCPDSGAPYIVIESIIHLPWSIAGDHLKPALSQGWTVVQDEVHRNGGQLLGWYHTHHGVEPRPSPADVDAHLALFDQAWQVALVVTPGERPAGGLFRISGDGVRANEYLPFYELLDAGSVLPDGRKVTDLAWVNYRTSETIISSDRVSDPGFRLQPHLLFPDDIDEDVAAPAPPPTPPTGVERTARVAGYSVAGVVAAAVLFNVYRALASSSAGAATSGQPVAVAAPRERVDRMADTVALAVGAFDLRARLFDGRKMACPDLARGLIDVEERWMSYNVARKNAAALDSARNARDRSLYSDVDAVERRFERSKCARP